MNRIDREIGGLDEAISRDGIDSVLKWGQSATGGPFETYPSHAKSVLKRYIQFILDAGTSGETDLDEDEDVAQEAVEALGTVFKLEKEMQSAVRKQLNALEPGLREADGGSELTVATGRIDILAEDAKGQLVVIELKAGDCPSGALEQALGYAEALSEERSKPVRAFLIAASFSDRIRAAAKRVRDLELRTYEFSLRFDDIS